MPSGLKRLQKAESLHFITFSCFHRFPLLEAAGARETVEALLEQTRARHQARIYAYVLMPEHVHLLVNEPPQMLLAQFLKAVKQVTSRRLRGPREVLAGPLLRQQRSRRDGALRSDSVHSSQSGGARTGCEARRLAVVELPALRVRREGHGGDRIAVDRVPAREPVACGRTLERGQTLVLPHPSRKRRSLDGAQRIEGESELKTLTGPPAPQPPMSTTIQTYDIAMACP